MLLARVSVVLGDFQGAVSEHPVPTFLTAMALISVLIFMVFGGGKAVSGAAAHAGSSAIGLLLLCAAFGVLFWNTFPTLFSQYADQDTLQHVWTPAAAAVAWLLLVARLRTSRRVRKWSTPPLAEQMAASRKAARLRR